MADRKSKMDNSFGTGGAHRSFVARRFLEDEEGDDLEPGTLDLDASAANAGTAGADSGDSAASTRGGTIFDRRGDQYRVDQSVNLMDTSAATYESKRKKQHQRPRGLKKGGMQGTSMVDVFLDYATEGGGGHRGSKVGDYDRSRKSKCRSLLTSTRFLVFIVMVTVVILMVVFGVKTAKEHSNSKGSSSSSSSSSASTSVNRKVELGKHLVGTGVTSEEDLKNSRTHAHMALKWLAEEDKAALDVTDDNLLQRYILAVLYYATQPATKATPLFDAWKNQDRWMTQADMCTWYGIDCETILGKEQIVHIKLAKNQLQGTIPCAYTLRMIL